MRYPIPLNLLRSSKWEQPDSKTREQNCKSCFLLRAKGQELGGRFCHVSLCGVGSCPAEETWDFLPRPPHTGAIKTWRVRLWCRKVELVPQDNKTRKRWSLNLIPGWSEFTQALNYLVIPSWFPGSQKNLSSGGQGSGILITECSC